MKNREAWEGCRLCRVCSCLRQQVEPSRRAAANISNLTPSKISSLFSILINQTSVLTLIAELTTIPFDPDIIFDFESFAMIGGIPSWTEVHSKHFCCDEYYYILWLHCYLLLLSIDWIFACNLIWFAIFYAMLDFVRWCWCWIQFETLVCGPLMVLAVLEAVDEGWIDDQIVLHIC